MTKSFIYHHILNIKKQQDISAPAKTTPITPVVISQDNITSSNLTVVIKEILKIKKDKLAKERKTAEQEKISKIKEHQKQEEARLFCETEERRLLDLKIQRLEQERIAREIEEKVKLKQEKIVQEQQALQLLQSVQILTPEIPVELEIQEIQKPVKPIVMVYIEPEQLHPIAEVQINEQEVIDNEEILVQPLQKESQPQLLSSFYIEEQPAEIIAPVPLEQESAEHPQEPKIPEVQESLALIVQPLIMETQEEENDKKLNYVFDLSDILHTEEGEYVMVELGGEYQEL